MTSRKNRPAAPQPTVDGAAVERILAELRRRLGRAGRGDVAAQLKKSLDEGVPCYGIKPAEVHNIGLEAVRQLRSGGMPLSLEVAADLFKSGSLEEGLIGAQLVGAMARHIGGGDFPRFEVWAGTLNNAQTAEALAVQCISRAMAAKPSIALRLLEWTKSPNPWLRLAAVSSFVPLVREGRFMTDALSVAEPIMNDDHEAVQRGVGTMLMEATRLQAPRVVEFLSGWKGKAPPLAMQLAATKLSGQDRAAVLG